MLKPSFNKFGLETPTHDLSISKASLYVKMLVLCCSVEHSLFIHLEVGSVIRLTRSLYFLQLNVKILECKLCNMKCHEC